MRRVAAADTFMSGMQIHGCLSRKWASGQRIGLRENMFDCVQRAEALVGNYPIDGFGKSLKLYVGG
jgi:hypothetical protein